MNYEPDEFFHSKFFMSGFIATAPTTLPPSCKELRLTVAFKAHVQDSDTSKGKATKLYSKKGCRGAL